MSDLNDQVTESSLKDYQENFMPRVHFIGRTTMAIAFVLDFLSVLYFFFIKGYQLPITAYLNAGIAIASVGIGMWLTEPLAYWPVLGSAGTYMAYLAGNVGGMRFPVSLSVQSAMKADINTPRGQVATIVGIAASIVTNLVVLLLVVLGGAALMAALPKAVISAFGFVMPCMMGCMLIIRFAAAKQGFVKEMFANLPFLATAVIMRFLINGPLAIFRTFSAAVVVGCCVIVAYIMYRYKNAQAEKEGAQA